MREIETYKINRVELITDQGREFVYRNEKDGCVELSIQDDGRTLKIFVAPQGEKADE